MSYPPMDPWISGHKFFSRHVGLAVRAAMALCRLSAPRLTERDWRAWTTTTHHHWKDDKLEPVTIVSPRRAPMPFEYAANKFDPDGCQLCGFQVFRKGHWRAAAGPKHRLTTRHACCTQAYLLIIGQVSANAIADRQDWKCAETQMALRDIVQHPWGPQTHCNFELDHRVPLWRVRLEWEKHPWPDCLRFWLPDNLQALSPAGHRQKTAREARERAKMKRTHDGPALPGLT